MDVGCWMVGWMDGWMDVGWLEKAELKPTELVNIYIMVKIEGLVYFLFHRFFLCEAG